MDMRKKMDLMKYYREQSDEVIKEFLRLGRDSFEEEAYDLILMETKHRRLKEEPPDIDALEAEKNKNNEGAAEMIPLPRNTLPLIIIDNPEDAQPFFKALNEAGIPYSIQIMVEAKDYEQADYVTNNLQLQNNNERGDIGTDST
ncbi:MAG: hypothetical protein A2W27_08535 [Deltaproteobacteria bacterium RBG_16_44_11]|nr:MAG: hypothetical protein A2W27_08535 [Deltaproteobacteria bacterium RBG_16_44_11]